MKHPLNTLRGRLAGKLKEDDLLEIAYRAQGTEDEPMKRALYRLLFDEDKRVAAQAAWVFCHFDRHTDEWLHDKHDALADEAMRTPDVRLRRLLLSLLLRQPFPHQRALHLCLAERRKIAPPQTLEPRQLYKQQ